NVGQFAVKERHRVAGRGFQVFGEPVHRIIAEYLAGVEPGQSAVKPNSETEALRTNRYGVLLLYPVREDLQDHVSIGFELQFPPNHLGFDMNFTVQKKSAGTKIDLPQKPHLSISG